MSLIDKTIYPFVNHDISKQILEQCFTVTKDEISFANTKYFKTSLCFLISLKFFKHAGYFVNISKCPSRVINYITEANQYEPLTQDDIDVYDMSKQSKRHQQIILEYLNIKPYDKNYTIKLAKSIAKTKDTQIDIINCIIEELLRKKYELPQFSQLEIIAQQIKIKVNYNYYQSIYSNLMPKHIKTINNEILIRVGSKSPWNNLKIEPEKPTLNNLRTFLQHYSWLKSIDLDNKVFKDVPLVKLDRFHQEATSLDLFRIKRMKKIKRIALVAVVIRKMASLALDDLGEMLIKVLSETETLAKHKLQLYKTGQLDCTDELVNTLKSILETYKTEINNKKRSETIDCLVKDNLDYLLEKCDEYDAYSKKDHLPFMQQRFDRFRKELLLCLASIQLRSSSKDKNIEKAINLILRHSNNNLDIIAIKEFTEENLTLDCIPLKWRKFIAKDKDHIFKKRLELFLFIKISSQLATRDLFIIGSNKFIDYTNVLISWKKYEKNIKEYGKIIDKPTSPSVFVKYLKQQLSNTCEQTDLAFNKKINAKIKQGKVFLEKIIAKPLPKDFNIIDEKLNEEISQVTLLNIIAHVAQSLHFEDFIKLKSDYDSKLSNVLEHIIAALFCYGCNISASEAAKSINNVSRKQIGWINTNYISEEILDKCIFHVTNLYNKFQLPKCWGTGEHASVDGSKWEMYKKNLMAAYSVRHGGYGGMGYYHVSDTYIALFSNFIACGLHEAVYMIEGVLKNESDIKPQYIHGDTHSQSLPIFALTYLLGIKLMPRIKGIKKLIFYKSDKKQLYANLNELLRDTIDWNLIKTHIKDMYRVALSIKEGTINVAIILDKICSKEPKNKIYYAFRELGKVVRTNYLLEYICDFDLRKVVHASTCKSEEFNEYRDWIAFFSDTIKTNDRKEQRKFIKYNHLVTNMVTLYNVQMMSIGINKLKQKNQKIDEDILQRMSPYRKSHIIRPGSYDLNMENLKHILCPINPDIEIY